MYTVMFSEKAYTKSVPKKMKMQLKGGGAVDPESGKTIFKLQFGWYGL